MDYPYADAVGSNWYSNILSKAAAGNLNADFESGGKMKHNLNCVLSLADISSQILAE